MKFNSSPTLASLILTSAFLIPRALANTEKVIFQAPTLDEKTKSDFPDTGDVPQHTVRRLAWYIADLPKLTHDNFTLDTHIERGFSNAHFPNGPETWVLLDDMKPGKRYEARVCWAATQPTSFNLDVFNLSEVFDDKEELFPSFVSAFHARFDPDEPLELNGFQGNLGSRMLLRIQAQADYFTEDENLMRKAAPVFVHLILEPCYFGILPHSTAFLSLYLVCAVIAIISLFIYASLTGKMHAMKSKGAAIMNEITLGEPDRDGYTSSMNRNSEDMEDREIGGTRGAALGNRGSGGPTRSASRGRTRSRGYWGSSAGTAVVDALDNAVSDAQGLLHAAAEELEEPETQGRGTPARGRGESRRKGAKKSRQKRRK